MLEKRLVQRRAIFETQAEAFEGHGLACPSRKNVPLSQFRLQDLGFVANFEVSAGFEFV